MTGPWIMLGAVRGTVHAAIVLAILVAAIAALGCAGDEDQPPASVEDVRPCLERAAADVMSPPPPGESFGLALQRSGSTSSGFVRPVGGSVAFLAFYATERTASDVIDLLKTSPPELVPGFVASKPELHGKAAVLWRLPVGESDRALLATCLESDAGGSGVTSMRPTKPLACVLLFLSPEATPMQVQRVRAALHREPFIRSAEFVSKKRALDLIRKRHPELTENLKGNPLPDSLRISPSRGQDALAIARSVRRYAHVDVVRVTALPCQAVQPTITG